MTVPPHCTDGNVACGLLLWRCHSRFKLTVVVKALFSFVPDGVAEPAGPSALVENDRFFENVPSRSVEVASDLAPYLPRCDVLLTGHAYVPPVAVPAGVVRLGLMRHGPPLLSKTIHVYGDRSPAGASQPFDRMPLVYERAVGGPNEPNPVGTRTPNLVDPTDPRRSAGFGPLARSWPTRARLLGGLEAKSLEGPIAEIPGSMVWEYFQAAPPDQQIEYLRGGEWLLLDGLHPTRLRVQTRLPALRGGACVVVQGSGTPRVAHPIDLVCDTLAVDADRQTFSLSWRGVYDVGGGEVMVPSLLVVAALNSPGVSVDWERLSAVSEGPSLKPAAVVRPKVSPLAKKTTPMSLEDYAAQPVRPVLPFAPSNRPASPTALPSTFATPWGSEPLRPIRPSDGSNTTMLMVLADMSPDRMPVPQAVPMASPTADLEIERVAWVPIVPSELPVDADGALAQNLRGVGLGKGQDENSAEVGAVSVLNGDRGSSRATASELILVPPAIRAPSPTNVSPPMTPSTSSQAPLVSSWAQGTVAAPAPLAAHAPVAHTATVPPMPPPMLDFWLMSSSAASQALPVSPWARGTVGGPVAGGALEAYTTTAPAVIPPADPLRPLAPPVSRAPRPDMLNFMWFDPESAPQIRKLAHFKDVLRGLEEQPDDLAIPEPNDDNAVPVDTDERRDLFEILARGLAVGNEAVFEGLASACLADGRLIQPIVLVAGDLCFPFDELEALRAVISTAMADPLVTEAQEIAKAFLVAPGARARAAAAALAARIREAIAKRGLAPAAYFEEQVKRALLGARAVQRRQVFGASHVRALLQANSNQAGANCDGRALLGGPRGGLAAELPLPLPVYVCDALASVLPPTERLRVRILARVHPAMDPTETSKVALYALALVTVSPPLVQH